MPYIVEIAFFLVLPFLPHPVDKDGVGLRLHRLSQARPFIAGEAVSSFRLGISLSNFSDQMILHDTFEHARKKGTLRIDVLDGQGRRLAWTSIMGIPPYIDPAIQPLKLLPGKMTASDHWLGSFGHRFIRAGGVYSMVAELTANGKKHQSPALSLEIYDEKDETILAETSVTLDEPWRSRPPEDRIRAVIQQVEVRKRIFLIYRRYNTPKDGAGISLAYPTVVLKELTNKAPLEVNGKFGFNSPLRIRFRETPLDAETELTIESLGGKRWTDEDERSRQEKLKKAKP